MSGTRRAWSKSTPCPICGGYPTLPQGRGVRCYGFRSEDGRVAFCTREEHAGDATFSAGANATAHRLEGTCKCGLIHGDLGYRSSRPFIPTSSPRASRADQQTEQPPLDADTLGSVYVEYLKLLPLRREHRDHLASRGETDLAVGLEHGYGSLPLGYAEARRVVTSLVARFGIDVMRRVPGFYPGKDGTLRTHTARADADALVVPGRDELGRISIMVRMRTSGEGPKYQTFAGTKAGEAYTVAGCWPAGARRQLVIDEGLHKSHVVAHLSTDLVVLGLPGAHLSDAHLAAVERLRPDVVIEGLDADKLTNENVARQREHMHRALLESKMASERRVELATAIWEAEDGKGLDDLLANGHRPRLRTIARRAAVTARKPHEIREPGPITRGRPLAEVQIETEKLIADFVRNRRTKHGRVKVVQVPPGVGKTTALATAVSKQRVAARILVSTKEKAAELAERYPWISAVEGRNPQNCANFDVADAARQKGHDVSELVCKQCPYGRRGLDTCQVYGYYSQFRRGGTLAAPVEFLYSGACMREGELVVLDDPSLERAMIDTRKVTSDVALHLAGTVPAGPTRELLTVVQRAIDTLREGAAFAPPLIGPAAWDELARAAGGASNLVTLIRDCPAERDILPHAEDGGPLTIEDIEAAPPAVLGMLLRILKFELRVFESGQEFNSGLSIHPGGLELRELREPLSKGKGEDETAVLQDKAVLVLDATPIMPLYERLADGLVMEPVYAPVVTLPPNVVVTQIADRFYGKSVVERSTDGDRDRRPGRDALLASLAEQRRRYPGDREAVICAKSLRENVIAAGVAPERVLTFFGSRGLNSIEDADVLHVLGRPQAPDYTALQLAHVLNVGGPPISPHMAMRAESYAGYRAADGTGRAITISDFHDRRASEIFAAYRESELIQAVHRARLFRVADAIAHAQPGLFDTGEQKIARTAGERRMVRLIVHSAHPIPGLRVDELIYGDDASVNERRAVAAAERIIAACRQLAAEGVPLTVNAVARATGANKQTIARVLPDVLMTGKFDPARFTPLTTTNTSTRVNRAQTNSGGSAPPEPLPGIGYPVPAPLMAGALPPAAGPHAPPLAAFARAIGDGPSPGGAS